MQNKKGNMKKLKRGISQKKYDYAKNIIPGGTQLLSKRPELFYQIYGLHIIKSQRNKYLGFRWSKV